MTHIMIIDSGVGGLSVLAYLERFLRENRREGAFQLTFANASPEDDYGYNSMPTRDEKLSTFDRFLRRAYRDYRPDFMYLACNTLSVLFPHTEFSVNPPVPVGNIVQTGIEHLIDDWKAEAGYPIVIFATPTTIEEGVISRELHRSGVPEHMIIQQSCPGLADAIASDFSGESVRQLTEHFVASIRPAIEDSVTRVFAYLGCTHYGYRQEMFQKAFDKYGIEVQCHNPNLFVIQELERKGLLTTIAKGTHEIAIQVVSRYRIPPSTQKALRFFLQPVSPETVCSVEHFSYRPDFF